MILFLPVIQWQCVFCVVMFAIFICTSESHYCRVDFPFLLSTAFLPLEMEAETFLVQVVIAKDSVQVFCNHILVRICINFKFTCTTYVQHSKKYIY